jgi:hypothetical protein
MLKMLCHARVFEWYKYFTKIGRKWKMTNVDGTFQHQKVKIAEMVIIDKNKVKQIMHYCQNMRKVCAKTAMKVLTHE